MLTKMTVQNVALIKSLEIDFCGRLNILSGETGAGKSIVVDCLLLLLGAKYDKMILRFGTDEGFVEGVFESDDRIASVLAEYGFEKDEMLIVSRRFFASGKNEIRINGRLSTALMLQGLTSKLVDIYGQNEYQSLSHKSEHLRMLNFFLRASLAETARKLHAVYGDIQNINEGLRNIGDAQERARNADMIRFQINEIKKANVYEGEEEALSDRRRIIASAEKIASALSAAAEALTESPESSAAARIDGAMSAIRPVSGLSNRFEDLYERLNSVSIEIADISDTCQDELSGTEFDPDELDKIERRLDVLRSLKRKYGDYAEMCAFFDRQSKLLDAMENGAYAYEKLQKEKTEKLDAAYALAGTLSALRKEGAKNFERLMMAELADLGMPGAVFTVAFGEFPSRADCEKTLTADGLDRPEFYFSANRGQPALPLVKTISGGELSRFMLALKTVSSRIDDIPTMIFDEIDTGISGKIGQEVAKKLAVIAAKHQVLCVTHLPQIASMADKHFYIEKQSAQNETFTLVHVLDEAGEVGEISRLSGAKDISEKAEDTARQMKEWSINYKKSVNK